LKEFDDPRQALAYARKAVEASHESRWLYLDQLARASQANGDSGGAAAQEHKALALLPAGSRKRKDLVAQLVKLQTGGSIWDQPLPHQ
jgi:hypothetical protein